MNGRPHRNSGIALLITLAFIVLVTVLVVGMAGSMRMDRPAASSHFEATRAELYAQTAVEKVVSTLRVQTADPSRNWMSQPGQLVVANSGSNNLQTPIPLSSGTFSGALLPAYLQPPNLNPGSSRDSATHLITDRTDPADPNQAIEMRVKWIFVRKSGVLDTAELPRTDDSNDPIIGRYAYWADDESSKVNYNLAWGRNTSPANSNPPGHPSKINLTALTGMTSTFADAIHNFIVEGVTAGGLNCNFFNTPAEAWRINADVAGILQSNKFEVTHYNHDPNTTFFNEPRIVLTTRPDYAGWTYKGGTWVGVNGLSGSAGRPLYLRILKNEGTDTTPPDDPGTAFVHNRAVTPWRLESSLDYTKISETINVLCERYMKRRDWPMVSGSGSIQDKYYLGNERRLAQLAVNIIDYVRSKESTLPLVEPLRPRQTGTGPPYSYDVPPVGGVGTTTDVYIGITRTPRITEMGLWLPPAPVSVTKSGNPPIYTAKYAGVKLKVEIYLPENFGIESIDLTQIQFWSTYNDNATAFINDEKIIGYVDGTGVTGPEILPNGVDPSTLRKGQYRTIIRTVPSLVSVIVPSPTSRPTSIKIRTAIARLPPAGAPIDTHGARLDIVPLLASSPDCTIDDATAGVESITSLQVDDPRVNAHKLDWKPASNTFGRAPNPVIPSNPLAGISTLGKDPTGSPQQDTDKAGKITDASLYMPPPAGQRFMRSNGIEDDNSSGKISSAGELGYVHTGMESSSGAGKPWRTLRLQPGSHSTSVVPDWAFIDLFTAPADPPDQYNRYLYSPHGTAFGGRINMNAKAEPFNLNRLLPLTAVLKDCSHGDPAIPGPKIGLADAQRIALNIHDRILAPDGKKYGFPHGYDSPGELVEIKGVADSGETSEELVRQITNLVTSRGNVFSVYSVGQAIRQLPNGQLCVTGEQRVQAMVERYLDPVSNQVYFRTVYYRHLAP